MITGLGIVSPIGIGIDAFWQAALEGRSGIGRPTLFDASKLPPECQIVGEVRDFDPRDWMPAPAAKMAGRFSQFAVASAKMALADSGLDVDSVGPEQVMVAIGNTTHGVADVGESIVASFYNHAGSVPPWTCLEYPAHSATAHVAIEASALGQITTIATACNGGLDAIAWGAEQIRSGAATAVLAGASETPLSPFMLATFQSVGVLSQWPGAPAEASRPYDGRRSGLVLSEGAAVLVIEEETHARNRGARIYATVLASGNASESLHHRKIDPNGAATVQAMHLALSRAGLDRVDIDYIAGHGSSLYDYDAAESTAIKTLFGQRAWSIPVSSMKSMCGQALAASSAMQVVAATLTLRDQIAPPTINYHFYDPVCDLDYVPNQARRARIRHVLIHAHGLGGSHTALVLGAA